MRINFEWSREKNRLRRGNDTIYYYNDEGVVRRPVCGGGGASVLPVALAPDSRFASISTAPSPDGQCDSETWRDETVRHRCCRWLAVVGLCRDICAPRSLQLHPPTVADV